MNLYDFMQQHGYNYNKPLPPIGKFKRFPAPEKSRANRGAWLVMMSNEVACFGDWITGQSHVWREDNGKPITPQQREQTKQMIREAQNRFDAQQAQEHEDAAMRAQEVWAKTTEADPNHGYLAKKRIMPFIARQFGKHLVIPIMDTDFMITSLQSIDEQCGKKFMKGGRIKGCFVPMPRKDETKPVSEIVICEGYATGASIAQHYKPDAPVWLALNAGNLQNVAVAMRAVYPDAKIIIACDLDKPQAGEKYGIGEIKGRYAAKAVDGKIWLPTLPQGEYGDFNDMACVEFQDE